MIDDFTSTGSKFSHHAAAMQGLRDGKPRPIVCHVIPTDICQHDCQWCSVSKREGNTLPLSVMTGFVYQLRSLGLKAAIVSGGGNPILYPQFNQLIDELSFRGLEIGLITNGMPLRNVGGRLAWKTVAPETVDKLTWVRISMSGLDHHEKTVYVPDVDRGRTTLGFSYVYAGDSERLPWLRDQIAALIAKHKPRYVRLLPNCLEVDKIDERCDELRRFADSIDPKVCFVQYKPPAAPPACYLGYVHPVLNSDGYVYPCDSVVLNQAAGHKFAEPWRLCRWNEIGDFYRRPLHSLVDAPRLCPGCVFTKSNLILQNVVHGATLPPPTPVEHPNFV